MSRSVTVNMTGERYHALLAALNANRIDSDARMSPQLADELKRLKQLLTGFVVEQDPADFENKVAAALRKLLRLEHRPTTCGFPADGNSFLSHTVSLLLRDPAAGADENLGEASFSVGD